MKYSASREPNIVGLMPLQSKPFDMSSRIDQFANVHCLEQVSIIADRDNRGFVNSAGIVITR
ncbi:MAG: hypothetical protein IJ520_02085 [Synergistaceae bacterium]|nr:hypothetical protein [Synergistaceae bacterium]MBR1601821.1 hypothetical protein [Synergistaceae bacterium]